MMLPLAPSTANDVSRQKGISDPLQRLLCQASAPRGQAAPETAAWSKSDHGRMQSFEGPFQW